MLAGRLRHGAGHRWRCVHLRLPGGMVAHSRSAGPGIFRQLSRTVEGDHNLTDSPPALNFPQRVRALVELMDGPYQRPDMAARNKLRQTLIELLRPFRTVQDVAANVRADHVDIA